MSVAFFDTGLPFKTNGVYVREVIDTSASTSFLDRLINSKVLSKGKQKLPKYSFINFEDLYNQNKNASIEQRFSISTFTMEGELFSSIKYIKESPPNPTAKNIIFDGYKLYFNYFFEYVDGSQSKIIEGDKYEIQFFQNSCEVLKIEIKTAIQKKYTYKFIELNPTFEERFNMNRF